MFLGRIEELDVLARTARNYVKIRPSFLEKSDLLSLESCEKKKKA